MKKWLPVGLAALGLVLVAVTLAAPPPRVADAGTKFHRVYIIGNGNDDDDGNDDEDEEASFEDDRKELETDLEGSNQAAGSTSRTLNQPTVAQVTGYLNQLKGQAEAGDEVTISFIGHGGTVTDTNEAGENGHDEFIRLSDGEYVSDDDWDDLISGFPVSVTIVLIMDSCYGGGMTGGADDLDETDHVAVVGMPGCTPLDPPWPWSGLKDTPTEDVADGTERDDENDRSEADEDEDGIVTADELKGHLEGEGWDLGAPPGAGGKSKGGKDKCADCEVPSILLEPPAATEPGSVFVSGELFAPGALVVVAGYLPDGSELPLGFPMVDGQGEFGTEVVVPQIPILIQAVDSDGRSDWAVLGPYPNQVYTPLISKDRPDVGPE